MILHIKPLQNNAKSDDVYFMAANWDPLHKGKIKALGKDSFFQSGEYIQDVHKVI